MLKYLNLDSLYDLDIIPQGVISSFSQMQVLNLYWCGIQFNKIFEDSVQCGGNELLVQELQCLKDIKTLGVSIKCITAFEVLLTSQMLLNSTQSLLLHNCTLQFLNLSTFSKMERLDKLGIYRCESLEDMKIDWEWERREQYSQVKCPPDLCSVFLSLGDVNIQHCPKLKDLTGLIFAPKLHRIRIWKCEGVEEIISAEKLVDAPDTTFS